MMLLSSFFSKERTKAFSLWENKDFCMKFQDFGIPGHEFATRPIKLFKIFIAVQIFTLKFYIISIKFYKFHAHLHFNVFHKNISREISRFYDVLSIPGQCLWYFRGLLHIQT